MSIHQTVFEDIFNVAAAAYQQHPQTITLDPISDLTSKSRVEIRYVRKPKLNATSAFMVFKKIDKNWIGLLLVEMKSMVLGHQKDAMVLHGSASAKSTIKRGGQTWYEFVLELHQDKIEHKNDISEAQAKQLSRLVDELGAKGFKLANCGSLVFVDENGDQL